MSYPTHTPRRRHHPLSTLFVCVLIASLLNVSGLYFLSVQAAYARVVSAPATSMANRAPAQRPSSLDDPVLEPPPPATRIETAVTGRTAFTRTTHNADGTTRTVFSVRPLHWQDQQTGEWKAFVNELRPAADDSAQQGVAFENMANGFQARFGAAAAVAIGRPLVHISAAGASISLAAPGLAPRTAVAQGPRLTYADAQPGVDLQYTLDNEQIKEDIILKRAPAVAPQAHFTFDLALDGVTAKLHDTGAVSFVNAAGRTVFDMPPPFMVDSMGRYSDAVTVDLTTLAAGRVRLTLTADLAWLQDAVRAYPVRIDPTIRHAVYGQAQDTTISEANPTTNYGSDTRLSVGKESSGTRQDTLLKFPDLLSLPQDLAITSAQLRLELASGSTGLPVDVQRITGTWDAATVTWSTAPSAEAATAFTVASPSVVDLTSLVRDWIQEVHPNHGVRLRSTGSTGQTVAFYSANHADRRPQLEVTYVQPTRSGPTSTRATATASPARPTSPPPTPSCSTPSAPSQPAASAST